MQEKHERRWESLIDHMMKANNDDVKFVMEKTKAERALNQSPLAHTNSKVSRKILTNLPVYIVRKAERLYGKDIWLNKKFLHSFARTFPIFKAPDRI